MNSSEKKFVNEDDWSLHMWQLPVANAYQLSSAYKLGQLRYVTARHGSMGIPRYLESEAYLDYCKQLDGDHTCLSADSDSNYTSIIMPAIKNMKTDCDKWKCHFDWNKFASKTNPLSSKSQVTQSDCKFSQTESSLEQLNLLATAIKQKSCHHVQQSLEANNIDSAACESDMLKGVCRPNHERKKSFSHVANDIKINNKNEPKYFFFDSNSLKYEQKGLSDMSCQNSSNNDIMVTEAGQKNGEMKLITHDNNLGASYNSKFGSNAHVQSHTNSVHFNESGYSLNDQVIAHKNTEIQFNNGDSYNKLSNSSSKHVQTGLNSHTRDNQLYNKNNNTMHDSDPHNNRKVYHWHQNINQSRQNDFRTANHQLSLNQMKTGANTKKWNNGSTSEASDDRVMQPQYGYGRSDRRSLGSRTACISSKFVPPIRMAEDSRGGNCERRINGEATEEEPSVYGDLLSDPRMKNIDGKMVELIMNEVLDDGPNVGWDDIAGLQDAKATIQEAVVWPMLRPDIFTGLRGPPKGVLLFGPPGTGKTMIGKAIASQSGATFFSISASCLTSKWIGEGEKMVRTLFAVARVKSPSVVFIDEIDSLLSQRSDTEHESSRRIKTEFLVQLDGVGAATGQVLVVGATNRPQELDEAARRRLVKRLYVPLPDSTARLQLIDQLLRPHHHTLTGADMAWVSDRTEGYSGADVAAVCSEAAMGPVRSISPQQMRDITLEQVRPMSIADFRQSVVTVRPSVCQDDLLQYQDWDRKYGSTRAVLPPLDT